MSAARKKKHLGRKHKSGGEAKKTRSGARFGSQSTKAAVAEAHDHKRGNIGPSGQGTHRGRERRAQQSSASGQLHVSNVARGDRRGR